MDRNREITCEVDGIEGELVEYRIRESGELLEGGRVGSFRTVEQRVAAWWRELSKE